MPVHPYLNAFTTGEITDQLAARQEWEKYAHAAQCLKNFVVRPHGGAARRAGLLYLGQAKYSDRRVRLVRFEFSVTQAYVVEFGHLYARFWANRELVTSGGAPVEVVTPYTEDELRQLRFEQSADVLYIGHTAHPPAKIQRTSATSFQYDAITFTPPPTTEPTIAPASDISLTAPSGFGVVVTASTTTFLDGDVGRQIKSGVGRAVIRTFVSGTVVIADVLSTFSSTGPFAAGTWTMDGSPNAGTLLLSSVGPEGSPFSGQSSVNAFRPEDLGKYIYCASGIGRIYFVSSATTVFMTFVKVATGTPPVTVAAGAWTMEVEAWSALLGYPGVPCLTQQRLLWGGSPSFPDRVWGSVTADYENQSRGVADDDALEYQLAMSGVNRIRWMKALPDGVAIGTLAGEVTLDGGGNDAPMTPSNVRAKERTFYGADFTMDAIRTTNLVLFLQRGAKRVREFTINEQSIQGEYVAPDITLVAEHLTREGLVEMDRAAAPDSIIFVVTADGILLSCAYERPENVVGWSHHTTTTGSSSDGSQDAFFESVCVLPNSCATGDEVYVAIQRLVNTGDYFDPAFFDVAYYDPEFWHASGIVSRRHVEVFDGRLNTDAALFYEGPASGTFLGLDHLDGLAVKAIDQDGTVYDLVVNGGGISLPAPTQATSLEVGLHFTSTLKTLRPELAGPAGTAQARRKRWATVTPRVYCTRGRLLLNGELSLEYPEGTDTTQSYTGDLARLPNFGWDREGQLTIQTLDPKPCTILALTGQLEMDDS